MVEIPLPYARRIQEAGASGEWRELADVWTELREEALACQDAELVCTATLSLVDALRRDDRPAATVRIATESAEWIQMPAPNALLRLQMVGALVDLGCLEHAERVGRELLHELEPGLVQPLVQDTLAGVYRAQGELGAFRRLVSELEESSVGPSELAARFRAAQLARLEGRLELATDLYATLASELEEQPGAAGGAAASFLELAEICALRDDLAEARSFVDRSVELWSRAGRRAGLFGAEALRSELARAEGASILPTILDRPLAYARERQLLLLEARLLIARGVALGSGRPLDAQRELGAAIDCARRAGARLLEGRARLELSRVTGVVEHIRAAAQQLEGDHPWHTRACVELACVADDVNSPEAVALLASAVCRFGWMGMFRDEEFARKALAKARL